MSLPLHDKPLYVFALDHRTFRYHPNGALTMSDYKGNTDAMFIGIGLADDIIVRSAQAMMYNPSYIRS